MLKHVSFLTRDIGATVAFYERLGATTEKDLTTPEGHRRAVLRLGDGLLQFFQITGETPAPHPHWAEHIALHVTGLRALLPILKEGGVTVTRDLQPSPSGRDMAFVQDPDGRQVELLEA
ncbi:VOC family protein [Deinococcus soli (ex Cha et al. 2016)]|uniref:VOC family protein n=1 Tax=Deinococcus soli (ex Cha et al. 2016) TaxID=1309411 RepID=UPI00166E61C6|nr:VOC family protein [Deinococcus soli (ex Cha et al. 2016)]GGB70152.1 lactoylglutathione lyase [Deinococcus soli (ex Cha et al. 2016)]